MSVILTKSVEEFVDDLRSINANVFFLTGYSPENMKGVKKLSYKGEILDVAIQIWGDLRVFAFKVDEQDSNLQCGINMAVDGFEENDPRLQVIRQRIYGYISQFNKRNNSRNN